MTLENAKIIAEEIFTMYDKNHSGVIERKEIDSMMKDAYGSINKSFSPSIADIDSYIDVLDADKDGKITLEDLESHVIRFLVGESHSKP